MVFVNTLDKTIGELQEPWKALNMCFKRKKTVNENDDLKGSNENEENSWPNLVR